MRGYQQAKRAREKRSLDAEKFEHAAALPRKSDPKLIYMCRKAKSPKRTKFRQRAYRQHFAFRREEAEKNSGACAGLGGEVC